MSGSPEELCRLAYERYSAGEIDAMLELFHPEVEVFVAPPNFESGTYRGHEEYRNLLAGAGFCLAGVIPTDSPFSIIEATPS